MYQIKSVYPLQKVCFWHQIRDAKFDRDLIIDIYAYIVQILWLSLFATSIENDEEIEVKYSY